MGFIRYHGKKEDRYSEILEYSRAQQEDERKRKEDIRVSSWLAEYTGDKKLMSYNIQQLLRLLMFQYNRLLAINYSIFSSITLPENCDTAQLWNDFSLDLADRHICFFHVRSDIREKHLHVFMERIFKLKSPVSAKHHIEYLSDNNRYQKYFSECYDPAENERYYYHLVQYAANKSTNADLFFDNYNKLCLTIVIYFYQVFKPTEDNWMSKFEIEISGIDNIREQRDRNGRKMIDPTLLINPSIRCNE